MDTTEDLEQLRLSVPEHILWVQGMSCQLVLLYILSYISGFPALCVFVNGLREIQNPS